MSAGKHRVSCLQRETLRLSGKHHNFTEKIKHLFSGNPWVPVEKPRIGKPRVAVQTTRLLATHRVCGVWHTTCVALFFMFKAPKNNSETNPVGNSGGTCMCATGSFPTFPRLVHPSSRPKGPHAIAIERDSAPRLGT